MATAHQATFPSFQFPNTTQIPNEVFDTLMSHLTGGELDLALIIVPEQGTDPALSAEPILREDLFKRVQTAVITSATLATDRRFDFLAARLGLDEPELERIALGNWRRVLRATWGTQ